MLGASRTGGWRTLAVLTAVPLVALSCGIGSGQSQSLAKDQTYRANIVADPFFDGNVAGAADYTNLDPQKDAAKIPAFLSGLGLSAPDDGTFVVKLQQPAPSFKWVASLFMSGPVRKDIVDKLGFDSWGKV